MVFISNDRVILVHGDIQCFGTYWIYRLKRNVFFRAVCKRKVNGDEVEFQKRDSLSIECVPVGQSVMGGGW